jgi:hypothetical protein
MMTTNAPKTSRSVRNSQFRADGSAKVTIIGGCHPLQPSPPCSQQ